MQYINPYIELCFEGSSSFFKNLNHKDKETLAQHHTLTIIKKGNLLFKEGEKPRGLICLASGKVKVFKEGVGGRQQILKMLKHQGFIGYRTLYSDSVWSFSAAAVEDSAICVFDKGTMVRIIKRHPDLAMRLIKIISEELWDSNNRIISLTQKHIRGRLAESLLLLRDTYGYEVDGKTIRISLSREDIANLSNMTTSNCIRTLSNLASEGIIEIEGRIIRIIESTNLEHISELG
jgi:CRP-like cAMP-binding protein